MKTLTKTATSAHGERERLDQQKSTRAYYKQNIKYGVISEVHPTRYAARVDLDEGGPAAGNSFLPIENPWQQLIHDFGELRPGLLVEVSYIGDQETVALAKIIGLENETIATIQEKPSVNLALYEVFI